MVSLAIDNFIYIACIDIMMTDDICSWCGLIMTDDQAITDIAGIYQHTSCVKKKDKLRKAGRCIKCEEKGKAYIGKMRPMF